MGYYMYRSLSEASRHTGISRVTLTRWLKSGRLSGNRRSRGWAGGPAAWEVAHSHIVLAAGEGWQVGPPPNERPPAPPTPPPALIEKRGFRRWLS